MRNELQLFGITLTQLSNKWTQRQQRSFRALKKQEQLAASHRIKCLWEEVQKQKDLEQILQKRHGNLLAELGRVRNVINFYRLKAKEEETAAENQSATNEAAISEPSIPVETHGNNLSGDPGMVDDTSNTRVDMEVDSTRGAEPNSSNDTPPVIVAEQATSTEDGNDNESAPNAVEEHELVSEAGNLETDATGRKESAQVSIEEQVAEAENLETDTTDTSLMDEDDSKPADRVQQR